MNKKEENFAGYAFIAPALIAFIVLVAFPFFFSIFLSFTKWNFLSGLKGIKMIGFDNFTNAFADKHFTQSILNTFIYALVTVPVSIFLSLILATVMNGKVYLNNTIRLAFIVPYISNVVALAAVFKFMFRETGPVNSVLVPLLNLETAPNWFSNLSLNRIPIYLLIIWTAIGYEFIIYIAALQGVPSSLYEAAEIDGANSIKKFFRITLPLISPTTFYLVVIRLIAIFKLFTAVNIMSIGTSSITNTTMVTEIYGSAFSSYKFGYASAEAMVLFLIILIVTRINFWAQKKWTHY